MIKLFLTLLHKFVAFTYPYFLMNMTSKSPNFPIEYSSFISSYIILRRSSLLYSSIKLFSESDSEHESNFCFDFFFWVYLWDIFSDSDSEKSDSKSIFFDLLIFLF
ncbi:hypothetical protein H012_gp845 [Acanthamoeba polyphaga moumouvirus]|uniref:Uncharacterized protein n=1 Tax=Acanthamoeba polyphaga moumouvirus TaxID=1269028 RepID=L7RFN3_9VIRU|nr:hypothetical protein H012_gp845 [Acanthamoeba polyphaga moumouvirus]AGC01620.1 hypothetical protein Moumou_00074 [Acanthamoeba polyphaga moumouvirus]